MSGWQEDGDVPVLIIVLINRTTSISKHLTGIYLFTITEGNRLTAIRLRNCFNEITGNYSSNQKGQIRMDNPAKLTGHTRRRQMKTTTLHVLDTANTNTNIINKTSYKQLEVKTKLNIVFMRKS